MTNPRLEVRTEREQTISLSNGRRQMVVRVLYRRPPTRRWTRFLLVPDEGQDVDALERHAVEAAALHAAGVGA